MSELKFTQREGVAHRAAQLVMELSRSHYRLLNVVIRKGVDQASLALLRMTADRERDGGIELTPASVRLVPIVDVPSITGNVGEPVVAIYVGIEGDLHGHAMLMMSLSSARLFCDMLLSEPTGTTLELDDIAISALNEAGNVCVSSFLNAISDDLNLVITPTPPQVVRDMAGAILETVVVELFLHGDEVFVIETTFVGEEKVPGHFLLLLDSESRNRLIEALV